MKKKLLCLNVELLKAFDRAKPIYACSVPSPKICSVFVTPSLNEMIHTGLRLIEDNNLSEVVFSAPEVTWFSSLEERIYQSINASVHISKTNIFYSGAFAPDLTPVFVSTRLPISSITLGKPSAKKELNLSFLSTEAAKALIAEIENLDRELRVAWDRQESLEELDNALDNLSAGSLLADASNTDALASEVSHEVKHLMQQSEQLEIEIAKKCETLCKRVLGIDIGDNILTQNNYKNNHQEIQMESVRYYDGTMYITGPKVLKTGKLGKRHETAYIKLVGNDEHK
ncbi:MAG: hypothetical protein ACI9O6_000912 [Glaciecola sp.]|jgi:hypothetical protein